MGLMIHSLEQIPENIEREYFLYLLDYGWAEPLSETIKNNFSLIADNASRNNAIFIKGIGSHVDSQILSWHHINGEEGEDMLPAILITTLNPHLFKSLECNNGEGLNDKLVIVPLKKCCETSSDVVKLIQTIFQDIKKKKILKDFSINKEMKKTVGRKIMDGVILQPNISGIGFDIRKYFSK